MKVSRTARYRADYQFGKCAKVPSASEAPWAGRLFTIFELMAAGHEAVLSDRRKVGISPSQLKQPLEDGA
jgi:hypothetical protein